MSKTYPLVVEAWGEDGEDLVSRGHHDPMTFLVAAVRYLDAEGMFHTDAQTPAQRRALLSCGALYGCGHRPAPDLENPCPALEPIKHQWWRWLPPRKPTGSEWDGMRYAKIVDGPAAGVFPITILSTGA